MNGLWITGHRDLAAAQMADIRQAVRQQLSELLQRTDTYNRDAATATVTSTSPLSASASCRAVPGPYDV